MDLVADSAAALALPDEEIAHYKQLVAEASNLYGATHYEHYHFLVGLSEHIFHSGIEHHESSLNTLPERAFIDKDARGRERAAAARVHALLERQIPPSRQPDDAGFPGADAGRHALGLRGHDAVSRQLCADGAVGVWPTPSGARLAGLGRRHAMDRRIGRTWRNLQDTATSAAIFYAAPRMDRTAARSVDFYPEGVLIWLEADTIIRQTTNGQRSMDDFCHAFHGGQSGPPAVVTYTFDDVVNTLNAVAPLRLARLSCAPGSTPLAPHAPLGGIENSGWQLGYDEHPEQGGCPA